MVDFYWTFFEALISRNQLPFRIATKNNNNLNEQCSLFFLVLCATFLLLNINQFHSGFLFGDEHKIKFVICGSMSGRQNYLLVTVQPLINNQIHYRYI